MLKKKKKGCSGKDLGRFAHNVPAYVAIRKWRVLKATPQMATQGAESAVYGCIVCDCLVVIVCYTEQSGHLLVGL